MGGPEITEYRPAGAYRISQCDATGRLVRDQTVVPVPTATGVAMLPVSQFTSDGSARGGALAAASYLPTSRGLSFEIAMRRCRDQR
jgi:hypothetical protein